MVPKIIIYGATSFTSQNVLPYLDTHPDASQFELILAGRNRQKLEATNAKLSHPREIVVCDLKDDAEVEAMVSKGAVVMSMAGPYRKLGGETIVRACAKLGKHYVDLCGETSWVSQILIPKYHDLARQNKACIVNSCGFDSVPSDMILYLAHRTLQARYPEMKIAKSTSMFHIRGGASGGTIATAGVEADVASRGGKRMGEWSTTPERRRSTTPRFIYYLPSIQKYGGIFMMYPYNRTIVRRSQYLSWSNSQTSGGTKTRGASKEEEPVYAKEMEYGECMRVGAGTWVGSMILSIIMAVGFGFFFASSWIRKLLYRFALPAAGTGPSQPELEAGFANAVNESYSDSKPPVEIKTVYKGHGDPGYLHTCYLISECALALAIDPPKGTSLPPRASEGGILTPASALGMVLVERLRKSGKVQLDSEIIPQPGQKKIE